MKKKIFAVTLIFVLIIGFACLYFFAPVNPAVSKRVSRTSPVSVFIYDRDGKNDKDSLFGGVKLENEDLSVFDKALFYNFLLKCEPAQEEFKPLTGGKTPGRTVITLRFKTPKEGKGKDDYVELWVVSTDDKTLCQVQADVCENYVNSRYTYELNADIDHIYKRYMKKGRLVLEEKRKNEKTDDDKYSEAIEKIKNS